MWREDHNPGLSAAYGCDRLDRLTRAFDDFFDRAEAFGLSEEEILRLSAKQSGKTLPPGDCPLEARSETVETAAREADRCPCFFQGLCLLMLPACCPPCPLGLAT